MNNATYHGGGPRSSAPAYAGGGGAPPVASGFHDAWIPAKDLFPNPVPGQNNPPLQMLYINPAGQFVQVVSFPQPTIGGSWVRYSYLPPVDVDVTVDPIFCVVWTCPAASALGVVQFHADWGAFNDGDALGGTGPGTTFVDTAAAFDAIQITPTIQPPNTGGFAWAQGAYVHGNIYRGSAPPDTIAGPVYVLGVRMRFTLV